MRTNKIVIIITSIVSFLSLAIATALNAFCAQECSFVINVLVGIFASGLVAIIVSIVNYSYERRRTLERFASYIRKAIRNYNRFENEGNLDKALSSVIEMSKFDYLELDNAYGDMDFLFFNKKTKAYIYNHLYKTTLDLRSKISETVRHIKEYYRSTNNNRTTIEKYLTELDSMIICRKTFDQVANKGYSCVTTYIENKVTKELKKELNGRYRKIMYPFERDKERQNET